MPAAPWPDYAGYGLADICRLRAGRYMPTPTARRRSGSGRFMPTPGWPVYAGR